MDGMEYGLFGPARIAQLEQEDMERYHRSILKSSSYQDSAAPDYQDDLRNQLLVLRDMMRRFSSDLKGMTSAKGSDNTIYDAVACDAAPTDDVLVVVELPDSEEIEDLGMGNDSLVEFVTDGNDPTNMSLPKSFLNDEEIGLNRGSYGLKVFSIYCAYMATKWNRILEMRPTQRNDMSVEIYYTQFFDWRKKLDEVDYIGGEESYVDDFLYGLKRELAVRVWEYKCKPHTLYGAFRRAQIEETLMKNDVDIVLEEMPHPNSINISIEGSLIEDESQPTHHVLPVFGKMVEQKGACKVFTEMPEPILEKELLGLEVTNAAHYLLDGDPNSYDLCYTDAVLRVSVTNSLSVPNLEFNAQVFDPGTRVFFTLNANESLHCITSVLLQVASKPQTDANLQHDFDYYSESETTNVSPEDEVLVEKAVPSSGLLPDFKYYVSHESTIKDSLFDAVSKLNEVLLSKGLISCEITVNSSINEVNKQNGENDNYWLGMFLTCISFDSDDDLYGKNDSLSSFPYIIETGDSESSWMSGLLTNISKVSTQYVSYVDDILGVSVNNYPSLSKLRFNPEVFDPGTLAFFNQQENVTQLNVNESQLHCVSSELFLTYSQVYGESRIYNYLLINIHYCLFEWARSRNSLVYWALWNSKDFLSWNCSTLLWICTIARADNIISCNDISTLPHAICITRPFADFCVSALAQICTTFDHAAPRLSNGHDIEAENVNIYFATVNMFDLRVPFGGPPIDALIQSCLLEKRSGAFSYSYDAPGAIYTLRCVFVKELGLVFVAGYQLFLHLSHVSMVLQYVASFHILESKDVFEQVGEWIIPVHQITQLIANTYLQLLSSSFAWTGMVLTHLGQCKNVLSFNNNGVVFIFDPGGSSCLLRTHIWRDHVSGLMMQPFNINLVHLHELYWVGDNNKRVKSVFMNVFRYSLKDFHTFMIDIFKDVACRFFSSWSHVMGQEIRNASLAISRKIFVMALFSISDVFFSWWKYQSKRKKKAWNQILALYQDSLAAEEDEEFLKNCSKGRQQYKIVKFGASLLSFLKHHGDSSDKAMVLAVGRDPFVWNPDVIADCHFTTLRTRCLLRGRICHDIAFLNKIYIFSNYVFSGL